MSRRVALLAGLAAVVGSVALSGWAYQSLPDRVVTHWDLAGHANGYSSRALAVAIVPALMGCTWLLGLVLPMISPRGFRLEPSAGPFYSSIVAILAVFLVLHYVLLHAEVTGTSPPSQFFFIPIGVLSIVLGSLMGRLKRNFFIGVRTPWTLASDEIWERSNRLGGYMLVLGGIVFVAGSFVRTTALVIFAILAVFVVLTLVPIAYSYFLYHRIEGFGAD